MRTSAQGRPTLSVVWSVIFRIHLLDYNKIKLIIYLILRPSHQQHAHAWWWDRKKGRSRAFKVNHYFGQPLYHTTRHLPGAIPKSWSTQSGLQNHFGPFPFFFLTTIVVLVVISSSLSLMTMTHYLDPSLHPMYYNYVVALVFYRIYVLQAQEIKTIKARRKHIRLIVLSAAGIN